MISWQAISFPLIGQLLRPLKASIRGGDRAAWTNDKTWLESRNWEILFRKP